MSDMDTSADRPWTFEAVQQLRELAREGVPVPVISLKLKRSIADWIEHPPGRTPDGGSSELPFYTLDFDFVLAPAA